MPTIPALTSFTANTQIKAAEVNSNFSSIRTTVNTYAALQDAAATITGAWTFSTAPTFSNAQTFAAGVTVTTGGITVTGNSTITGTLGGLTGLTVTGTATATTFSGSGASLTNLPAANITGTLPAISGANLTSLNGSNIGSGTVAQTYLPSTYSGLTSSNSVTITGGAFNLNQTTGTPPAFVFAPGNTYVTTGASAPAAFGSTAPAVGSSWAWVRVTHNGATGYLPLLIA
jgi:hypothetical protein